MKFSFLLLVDRIRDYKFFHGPHKRPHNQNARTKDRIFRSELNTYAYKQDPRAGPLHERTSSNTYAVRCPHLYLDENIVFLLQISFIHDQQFRKIDGSTDEELYLVLRKRTMFKNLKFLWQLDMEDKTCINQKKLVLSCD